MKKRKTKVCFKCKKRKKLKEFGKRKETKDGLAWRCKPCCCEDQKKWYYANKEVYLARSAKWKRKNKERVKEYKKIYNKKNAKAIQKVHGAYLKRRRKEDLSYRLQDYLRCRMRDALKRGQKSGSAVRDLGCSILEFIEYITSKFEPGMSWENYGFRTWHLDHIIPLASFDLTDRKQFLKACHYTNFQPLWAGDNIRKKDKILP